MSQINILIIVDVDNIKYNNDTGEITNPQECIAMYGDELQSYYKPDLNKADMGTYVSSGDLLVWTILPKDAEPLKSPTFDEIKNTSKFKGYLFNNSSNRAIIYQNGKQACGAISDGLIKNIDKDHFSYKVTFKIGTDKYWWDPFIEIRDIDQ